MGSVQKSIIASASVSILILSANPSSIGWSSTSTLVYRKRQMWHPTIVLSDKEGLQYMVPSSRLLVVAFQVLTLPVAPLDGTSDNFVKCKRS